MSGVAMLRKCLREGIQAVQRGERVPLPPQDGSTLNRYTQSTVIPIPVIPGKDDDMLLRDVAQAVFDTVASGDAYTVPRRTEHIRAELRKIPSDPRFVASAARSD